MVKEFDYDYLVIGGGSGGIGSANRAALYGAKVAVVEAADLGGACVNRGCVPKKASWYAASISDGIQHYGKGYGFTADNVQFNYAEFVKSRDAYVLNARNSYTNYFAKNNVEIIRGYAKLVDAHTVEVNGQQFTAQNILLSTGARPRPLNVEGHELTDTSDDFFKWEQLPKSVVIVGAGYIAIELAGVLNSFGVETHLAIRHDKLLRRMDDILSDTLQDIIEKSTIHLHQYAKYDRFTKEEDGRIACWEKGEKKLVVEKVIAAIGRVPNVEHVGLENAGVELDQWGYVKIDENHRTTAPSIFAVGDITGQVELTPVAIRAGRQVSEYLFNGAATGGIDYSLIPTVVFSHPPMGTIGYSQVAAEQKFGAENIKVYTSTFNSMYPRVAGYMEPSKFKLVCLGKEEKIIGLHGIGQGVDEMIQGFAVAMVMGATKADFDATIAIHPTGAEEFVTMR